LTSITERNPAVDKLVNLMTTERFRGWLYRVLCAVGLVLLSHNVVTGAELEVYLILAAEVLGTGLASVNTSIKPPVE
jgi:hypothetical protein